MKTVSRFAALLCLVSAVSFAQNRTRFAGNYNAVDYAYGVWPSASGPLKVDLGNAATGSGTVTLAYGFVQLGDGTIVNPLATNAPITIGVGTNAETITPSAVSCSTPQQLDTCTVTATFANLHGTGDFVTSGTFGLQEAINAANAVGGGRVTVDARWIANGGTSTILAAAALPQTVTISDLRTGVEQTWANRSTSPTVVSAPAAFTSSTINLTTTTVGTWTAGTVHSCATYVTALGGESTCSTDFSFTSIVSVAIIGNSPAASTGAVGYRLYLSAVSGSAANSFLIPITTSICPTTIQAGPVLACAIGSNFTVATPPTTGALKPGTSSAFPTVIPQPIATTPAAQTFQTVYPPFATIGTVATTATGILGEVQLPAGFLNFVNKSVRLCGNGNIATNATTGTLTLAIKLQSLFSTTSITPFTAVSGTTTGSAVVPFDFCVVLTTAATGASGTLEAHGWVGYGLAGTAPLTMAADIITAVSSAIDLTKQDVLAFTMTPTTTGTTDGSLRQLTVEVLN